MDEKNETHAMDEKNGIDENHVEMKTPEEQTWHESAVVESGLENGLLESGLLESGLLRLLTNCYCTARQDQESFLRSEQNEWEDQKKLLG